MENLTIGSITNILILVSSLIGGIEFLALRMRKYIKTTMKDEIDPLKAELEENSLNTMKNTICNELIPLSERITIVDKYIEKGGNGAVKIYGNQLKERYEKELKKEGK